MKLYTVLSTSLMSRDLTDFRTFNIGVDYLHVHAAGGGGGDTLLLLRAPPPLWWKPGSYRATDFLKFHPLMLMDTGYETQEDCHENGHRFRLKAEQAKPESLRLLPSCPTISSCATAIWSDSLRPGCYFGASTKKAVVEIDAPSSNDIKQLWKKLNLQEV